MLDKLTMSDPCSLHFAVRQTKFSTDASYPPKSLVELIAAGFDVELPFPGSEGSYIPVGDTPLHVASRHRVLPAVRFLLEQGANPNVPNRDRMSPLHLLVMNDDIYSGQDIYPVYDIAYALIKAGADTASKNGRNRTPLQEWEQIESQVKREVEVTNSSRKSGQKSVIDPSYEKVAVLLGRKPRSLFSKLFG